MRGLIGVESYNRKTIDTQNFSDRQPSAARLVHRFDHRIKLLLSLSCHHSAGGVLGDGLRAQKISLSRILRCSVFRLRRMRLSRPSHSIVCSYAR
jgi:hypothetical protein